MSNNLFQDLHAKKDGLKEMVTKARDYGWIKAEDAAGLTKKIAEDTLTIGVIGQMKCGKSTFLNSFVFGDTVLPAATTPMTAALSVITYGEEKKLCAEFYTPDEWEEQKMTASRNLSELEGNTVEHSKVKAAQELVAQSANLGSNLPNLLGRTQTDTLDNLEEYVGAKGKYVSITKNVTIYYPHEYLRGVEIVDTPGFNDPIVSREERTKAFLKRADVVVMMLYAGRPFDSTDRDILTKNVKQCGIGKVLIGINKYDIPLENGEDENQIRDYVARELLKASTECDDETLKQLLQQTTPIPLSAEMGLLSQLPMTKIVSNDALKFALDRHYEVFGIGTQPELRELSHIDQLSDAIRDMVATEKEAILFAKPINAIMAAGNAKWETMVKERSDLQELLKALDMTDEEMEEYNGKLERAHRRLTKKIEELGDDIDEKLKEIKRKGSNAMEDSVDGLCKKLNSIVDNNYGRFSNVEEVIDKIENEKKTFVTRNLKRLAEGVATDARNVIQGAISEYATWAEEKLSDWLPELESHELIKSAQQGIAFEIDRDAFSGKTGGNGGDDDKGNLIGIFADCVLSYFTYGGWALLKWIGSYSDNKHALHERINSLRDFDPNPYIDAVFTKKDEILDKVKQKFVTELITPLQKQLEEAEKHAAEKEQKKAETQARLVELEKAQAVQKEQTEEMERMKASLA